MFRAPPARKVSPTSPKALVVHLSMVVFTVCVSGRLPKVTVMS